MITLLLFSLLWLFPFVSTFLPSLMTLILWLKFSTDKRQAEDMGVVRDHRVLLCSTPTPGTLLSISSIPTFSPWHWLPPLNRDTHHMFCSSGHSEWMPMVTATKTMKGTGPSSGSDSAPNFSLSSQDPQGPCNSWGLSQERLPPLTRSMEMLAEAGSVCWPPGKSLSRAAARRLKDYVTAGTCRLCNDKTNGRTQCNF